MRVDFDSLIMGQFKKVLCDFVTPNVSSPCRVY